MRDDAAAANETEDSAPPFHATPAAAEGWIAGEASDILAAVARTTPPRFLLAALVAAAVFRAPSGLIRTGGRFELAAFDERAAGCVILCPNAYLGPVTDRINRSVALFR